MSNPDILGELKPYFDKDIKGSDLAEIDVLADVFQRDVIDNPIRLENSILTVKPYKYSVRKDSGLPDFYGKYNERFVHIITRKENNSKIREFRSDRANRIHWIKPILENHEDKRITHFAYVEDDGAIRNYYWYRSKMYMVVVENINVECSLITGFCIDSNNKDYYQRKYTNRIK